MIKKVCKKVLVLSKIVKEKVFYPNKRVNLLVIGAQKCGTTALHQFLSYHPDVIESQPKEVHFFNFDNRYNRGKWFYHTHFDGSGSGKVLLDASPSYFMDNDSIACKRIHQYNPDVKLILLLRNPIKRAFSAYTMYKKYWRRDTNWFLRWRIKGFDYEERSGQDFESFNNFIEHELAVLKQGKRIDAPVLALGKYYFGVEEYYATFDKEQLLVLEDEYLLKNTERALNEITNFADLASFDWNTLPTKRAHVGMYDEIINEETIVQLKDFYQVANQKLFNIIGKSFNW